LEGPVTPEVKNLKRGSRIRGVLYGTAHWVHPAALQTLMVVPIPYVLITTRQLKANEAKSREFSKFAISHYSKSCGD
jgi:hypothetical protein